MRWLLLLWLMLGALSVLVKCGSPRSFVEDNDFAEFEEFDEEEGRQFENLLLNTVFVKHI